MLIITLSHKLSLRFRWFRPVNAHSAVVADRNHFFAHYSTTLLVKLYMTSFLFDV